MRIQITQQCTRIINHGTTTLRACYADIGNSLNSLNCLNPAYLSANITSISPHVNESNRKYLTRGVKFSQLSNFLIIKVCQHFNEGVQISTT